MFENKYFVKFDNNNPSAPYNPNLVCELERIHNNHNYPSSHSYKLLGIIFDKHLSFNYHIDYLKSKLAKALFCINRVKNFVPQKTLSTIYHSLFHSHLQYCPLIVHSPFSPPLKFCLTTKSFAKHN